jgi:hypothetical protein
MTGFLEQGWFRQRLSFLWRNGSRLFHPRLSPLRGEIFEGDPPRTDIGRSNVLSPRRIRKTAFAKWKPPNAGLAAMRCVDEVRYHEKLTLIVAMILLSKQSCVQTGDMVTALAIQVISNKARPKM